MQLPQILYAGRMSERLYAAMELGAWWSIDSVLMLSACGLTPLLRARLDARSTEVGDGRRAGRGKTGAEPVGPPHSMGIAVC